MPESECDKLLVRGVNWIGDAVMTMPALRSLRASYPEAKISLLVKPWVSPLFEKDPSIDEIILYSDEYRSIPGRIKLARKIRQYKFRSAVLLQNAFDAALIAALSGIPERIGYSRDGRGLLLTRAVSFNNSAAKMHHVNYYLNLLASVGIPAKTVQPWLYLSLEERLSARNILKGMKRPVVGLNPGATYGSSKRWAAGRFGEVAKRVIDELGGSVVIFGGTSEIEIAETIYKAVNIDDTTRVLLLAGRTPLRQLAALVSESDVLVTNDSGPMHIGYAVGTPLVAIFGSTSPELTGPPDSGNIVLRKKMDCAPCFERVCRRDNLMCMDAITPDEVFSSIKRLLKPGKAVFFDRDGTLCKDAHYLNSMERFEVFPETGKLRKLKERGFHLIGVTNQSGIARGIVEEKFVHCINDIFIKDHGFERFYYCPHHPDEHCSCRKPEPGLLVNARNELGIDLRRSFVVGDKESDMSLARAVGATGIFVTTGQGRPSEKGVITANSLAEVVDIILRLQEQC